MPGTAKASHSHLAIRAVVNESKISMQQATKVSELAILLCRHVNRKALDEYASFTEQKSELKRRQEENARGEAKIKQLIQTLDLRKDEAIERTFKVEKWHLLVAPSIHMCRALALLPYPEVMAFCRSARCKPASHSSRACARQRC